MRYLLTSLLLLTATTAQANSADKAKAEKERQRQCEQYLTNMEYQLSKLDTKDLIRYSAQMNNFDAWKWPYFAKRCSADKYANLLHRYNATMNKVHSNWR